MSRNDVIESYISAHTELLMDGFLFADKSKLSPQDVKNAIENSYAVLVGSQLLPSSESQQPPSIDVVLDEAYPIAKDKELLDRLNLLKVYWDHFLESKRGKISAPHPAPWRLMCSLSAHMLRLANYVKLNFGENEAHRYFQCVEEARKMAQRLAMVSPAHAYSKWLEGLSYIWQVLAGGDQVEKKHKDQILKHAKKLLVEAVGTTLNSNRNLTNPNPNCLEEPCALVLGTLSEILGLPMEAIWWYRKYKAENVVFSYSDLPPELSVYLQSSSPTWASVVSESRSFCTEMVSAKAYESLIVYSPISTPSPVSVHPSSSLTESYAVPTPTTLGLSALHSISTSQFLERSRRNLELSVAMPTTVSIPIGTGTRFTPLEQPKPPKVPEKVQIHVSHPTDVNPEVGPSKPDVPTVVAQVKVETMEERLNRRIELFGLVQHRQVPGDGNCQFYSLSDQLYNDFLHAGQIRANCVDWLRHNADLELDNGAKLKEFGHDDDGWDHYCTLMSLTGTWGDHLTLVAAAELFQVRIVIISSATDESQAVIEIVPSTPTQPAEQLKVIYLCHYAEFHYGTLQPDGQ